eukprot:GDKK01026554.1.p3 GENE.GDKK01026554.1~~GDKK01026554.1.p3  ORF type:complete len:100 (-),score=1.22 GDKK01026554.1:79-378(-)
MPHFHIHILPRQPGDFQPADKVYDALDGRKDAHTHTHVDADEHRKPRSREEMTAEASEFRECFRQMCKERMGGRLRALCLGESCVCVCQQQCSSVGTWG